MGEDQKKEQYRPSFSKKIDNFWYHYKWHTIVAVFLIVTILICSFQMCSKENFDSYILYAGSYGISRTVNDDVAEYTVFLSSLKKVSDDTNGDGEIHTSFLDLYILSSEELSKNESDLYSLMSDNVSRLEYELVSGGQYYVCFLSKYNYEEYKEWDGITMFLPLSDYVSDGANPVYYDDSAIYLNSLPFGKLDGFKNLPDDTLVCLRVPSAVASFFDKDDNERKFAEAEKIIERILSYN